MNPRARLNPLTRAVAAVLRRIPTTVIAVVAIVTYAVAVWYGIGGRAFDTWDFRDFDVYRAGGAAVLNNHPLYSAHPPRSDLLFTYPPFAALVFVPFELGVVRIVEAGITVVSLGAVIVLAYECLRGAGRPSHWRTGWSALLLAGIVLRSQPIDQTLHLGQLDLVIVAMALGDLLLVSWSRRGWLLGAAAGLKPTPLVLILYLLLSRQWRAAAQAVVGFGLTVGVGYAVLPGTSRLYWGTIVHDVARIGSIHYVGNQSLTGLASRITAIAVPPDSTMLTVAAVALGCAALLVLAWLRGGGTGGGRRASAELETVSLIAVAGLLASPISWTHQWIWWLPVAVALGGRLATARGYWAPVGWALALVAWAWATWHGPTGIRPGSAPLGGIGFGRTSIEPNIDVLAGIALLVAAAIFLVVPVIRPSGGGAPGPATMGARREDTTPRPTETTVHGGTHAVDRRDADPLRS